MGNSFSGRRFWPDKKLTLDDFHELDIGFFTKRYKLEHEIFHRSGLEWHRNGKKVSSIGYEIDTTKPWNHHIRVFYKQGGEEFNYNIELGTTTPNFGGLRWWFICPNEGCGARVSKLYVDGKFQCRHCLNLAYQSQQETPHYRLLSQAQKLHSKLGGTGCTLDPVFRPKGMHKKTFNEHMRKLTRYGFQANRLASEKYGMPII